MFELVSYVFHIFSGRSNKCFNLISYQLTPLQRRQLAEHRRSGTVEVWLAAQERRGRGGRGGRGRRGDESGGVGRLLGVDVLLFLVFGVWVSPEECQYCVLLVFFCWPLCFRIQCNARFDNGYLAVSVHGGFLETCIICLRGGGPRLGS